MTVPSIQQTILDPKLKSSRPSTSRPAFIGVSSAGPLDTLVSHNEVQALVDEFGEGPNVEAAALTLTESGGPVLVMRTNSTVAAVLSAVTAAPVGTATGTITVATTPNDSYQAVVEITKTGDVGAGEFKYSLDFGRTFSAEIVIPAGGTFVLQKTGLTLTFVPGAGPIEFELGDAHTFTATAAHYNVADLGTANTAIKASLLRFDFAYYTGRATDSVAAALNAAAVGSFAGQLENVFRYVGMMIDSGDDTPAGMVTAFANVANTRLNVCAETADLITSKPIIGWGVPERPSGDAIAALAAAALISTDLARFAEGPGSGALSFVVAINFDTNSDPTLDDARFSTLRTWEEANGFYVANSRMMIPLGSDFEFWQFRRVMDVACATTFRAQLPFSSGSNRTNPLNVPDEGDVGTIDDRDAKTIESDVLQALDNALTRPVNAEGVTGHASDVTYTVNRHTDLLNTKTINTEVGIRPLGYSKTIITQLGFTSA